jgi:integration host factor subunit alpha
MTTITRAALNDAAVERTGLAKADVAAVADSMLRMMAEALMAGENVKLTAFGSLQVRSRAERMGRNPRTGTEHRITPRHTVVFTPSAQLREALGKFAASPRQVQQGAHEEASIEG